VQHDVNEGRRRLNFSTWGSRQRGVEESARDVERGRMPPAIYLIMHPEAALSATEKQLIDGFIATFGQGDATTDKGGASSGEKE
jgi:hypothetical protein